MQQFNILIVEDEPLVAEDIRESVQEAGFRVAGVAYSVAEVKHLLRTTPVDALVLDINLGGKQDGIDLAHFINKHYQLPFIFLTAFADRSTLDRVKDSFPMGYIVKPFTTKDLLAALEVALANFQNQQKRSISLDQINRQLEEPVTPREFEVIKLLIQGKSNQEMAGELFVSINTVKTHLSHIYTKFDVESRAQVMARIASMAG